MTREHLATAALLALFVLVVAIVPRGEDNPPAVIKTAAHREWVREQCARPDLSEDEITACKNFWENRK
ncbi:hypothetical protein [uncultured Cardiobacterium sp.]|uniref:hypothetical protein n=1 Tax=uncultured Cardiobacterium sp. TaxID=417619 RepID=UPI00260EA17F|nr:hypothetical protein [uncultured Cardiobacterium sp.]